MPMIEYELSPEDQGKRLDVLLSEQPDVASRTQAVRLIATGAVMVNGQSETAKQRVLQAGDRFSFDPAKLESRRIRGYDPRNAPQGEPIPLDIRFEDDDLIVLSKQAGLVCHPATGHFDGTLVNALVAHCGIDHLAHLQGDDRPGIIHRLDKDTSGLMVVAKTDDVGRALSDAIRLRSLDRRYLTLVHGNVSADSGLIDAPLIRGGKDRLRYVVSDEAGARGALTSFRVLERFAAAGQDDGYSLLECKLFSGRTHQIRVHMAYTQHPVVGDPLYGSSRRGRDELGLTRQFLHSFSLEFIHPVSGVELEFRDALPDDLRAALRAIQGESRGRTALGEDLHVYFDTTMEDEE
jgi:23S rRNA pseudouridine1911/1915/1917 synthase